MENPRNQLARQNLNNLPWNSVDSSLSKLELKGQMAISLFRVDIL